VSKEPEDDEVSLHIVCAGPPYCDLKDDEAIEEQKKGCIWCSYIYCGPGDREHIEQPGIA